MIHLFPEYLTIVTSMFIAPLFPHVLAIVFVAGLSTALVLKRSFHGRTLVLLSIFGIMFVESLQMLLINLGIEHLKHLHAVVSSWNHLAMIDLNIVLSLVGVIASICVAVYTQFRMSRMDLATAFPTMTFIEPTKELNETVQRLAQNAGTRIPEAILVDSGNPAAFILRVNRRYIVAATVGLLESLDEEEVEACIAHEVAHLKNNDFPIRILATLAKVALFSHPISYFIEPAIYRSREYLADRTAALLTGGPEALASALSKLQESASLQIPTRHTNVGAIHLCDHRLNSKRNISKLFNKHPDLQMRISILQEMINR